MVSKSPLRYLTLAAIAFAAYSGSTFAQLRPNCEIPYRHIAISGKEIESCPERGDTATADHKSQDRPKNSLRTSGKPVPLRRTFFECLHRAVDDYRWHARI